MNSREILGLCEAYSSIYEPQELTEEVQIAAQYFYEMGLNEDGVDILIEELGVEEFADFVYDIAEEYTLTEARSGGVRVEPVTAKGQKFKSGKPTGKSLERLRAQKAARREAEEKASSAKPSGMKASLQRQSAVASAAKKQPKKPGVLDRIAGAVNRGIERHNAAMSAARETGKVIGKVAKGAGQVAREVGKGASGTLKLAGHLATKGLKEEVEAWVEVLVDNGYDLSSYTWDEMFEIYIDEAYKEPNLQKMKRQEERHTSKAVKQSGGSRGSSKNRANKISSIRSALERGEDPRADGYGGARAARGNPPEDHRAAYSKNPLNNPPRPVKEPGVKKEEFDLFDYLLEYLVAEGYADTNKAALAIMANMSEEWKQNIIEQDLTARQKYLVGKVGKMNKREPGSAHKYTPGKQSPGAALDRANTSAMQMRGESKEEPQKPFTGEGPNKPKDWKPTGPKLKTGQRPGYAR